MARNAVGIQASGIFMVCFVVQAKTSKQGQNGVSSYPRCHDNTVMVLGRVGAATGHRHVSVSLDVVVGATECDCQGNLRSLELELITAKKFELLVAQLAQQAK